MGLTGNDARVLLRARRAGASFAEVGMIGRLQMLLTARETRDLVAEFSLDPDAEWLRRPFGAYAEPFFEQALCAQTVESVDVSAYEDATRIADLNRPVSSSWDQRYDAVVDGGSLEHIFNVPVALSNLMRMTRVGGRVFLFTPANNLCGHGFYQFSPELLFRAFSEPHGFRVRDLLLAEYAFPGIEQQEARAVYRVRDPDLVGDRVGLMSPRAAMLLLEAEKLRHLDDPFAVAPQQSDYTARWMARRGHGVPVRRIPEPLLRFARRHRLRWRYSTHNRRVYARVR